MIVDQVRGSRLCPAALLADATYLNAAIRTFIHSAAGNYALSHALS